MRKIDSPLYLISDRYMSEDFIFRVNRFCDDFYNCCAGNDDEKIKNLFMESCHNVIGPIDLLREFKLSNSQKIVSDICRQMRARSKNIAFT